MKQRPSYLEIKFVLGLVTLVVGLLAANLALFHWVERSGLYHMLGEYARYVCAYGGFAAMIFGAMLINDFLVLRSIMKKKYVIADKAVTLFYDEVKEKEMKRIVDTRRKNRRQKIAATSLAIFLFMLCPLVVSSILSYTATVVITPTSVFEYGYAFISSDTRVSIDDTVDPVDDPEAVLNITLTTDSHVFIIYNAGNELGSTEDAAGKGCAINIDGSDVAFSWQSPYSDNKANSVTVVYATNLTAGSHIIKGRFFGHRTKVGAGVYTVGKDKRQLAAFWFPNVVAKYVRSTTASTTTSGTPVDDPEATLTFTLSSDSVVFIVYNAGNRHGSTEPARGKGVTINIDGTDIATRQWQSPYASNYANSATIVATVSLAAGSHTIKGRFFSGSEGSTTTIDERQLIVFSFPSNLIQYGFVQSATSVSTSSGTPVDDTEAVLSDTLAGDSDVLMMYVGGNPYGATEDYDGKGVQLQIDGADKSNSTSWQSPYGNNYANSVTSLWCEQLTSGSHTVKGRFFANYPGYTVTISHRQLLFLAFPKP